MPLCFPGSLVNSGKHFLAMILGIGFFFACHNPSFLPLTLWHDTFTIIGRYAPCHTLR
jgi:hypothetical protein